MMPITHRASACGAGLLLAAGLALLALSPVHAHQQAVDPKIDSRPAPLREVAFDQRVNDRVPLDLRFQNTAGNTVQLRDVFADKPVILVPVYFRCADLCPLLLDGVAQAARKLSLKPGDYSVVVFSFDARDTAALARSRQTESAGRAGSPVTGWHFLTGDETAIRRLTDAIGFRFTYDRAKDTFAHASGIVLLTPEGRIFRYQYGIEFSPQVLQLGLVEASDGALGTPVDQVLLFCYHYDPATGKYTVLLQRVLKLAALLTAGGLATTILLLGRHHRRQPLREV
jgi:protein SCO1